MKQSSIMRGNGYHSVCSRAQRNVLRETSIGFLPKNCILVITLFWMLAHVTSIPSYDQNDTAIRTIDKHDDDSQSLCDFRSEELKRCLKCKKDYILNQNGNICIKSTVSVPFCLQITDEKACMRCDCGYSLQEEFGLCIESPYSFIGCEVLTRDYNCIRPKQNFELIMNPSNLTNTKGILRYSRGSHCEIRILGGDCQQCHSGYLLDSSMECVRSVEQLHNEFISYYSNSTLKSRYSYFIAGLKGVYPEITFCVKYSESQEFPPSAICIQCSSGRVPSRNAKQCHPIPFLFCERVDDQDPSICIECTKNDILYSPAGKFGCLPRIFSHYDGCEKYSIGADRCRQCYQGFILQNGKCIISAFAGESETPEFQEIASCGFYRDKNRCQQCFAGYVIDTDGFCHISTDPHCQLEDPSGRCVKCTDLMVYDEALKKCSQMGNHANCIKSDGKYNRCSLCTSKYYPNQISGKCESVPNEYLCKQSNGLDRTCLICFSLAFLQKIDLIDEIHKLLSFNQCVPMAKDSKCIFSDGINDICLRCKRGSIPQNGKCVSNIQHDGQNCFQQGYYIKALTDRTCQNQNFPSHFYCLIFHPTENKCLLCKSGYFLNIENSFCENILYCEVSDGINKDCYTGKNQFYVDLETKLPMRSQKKCDLYMFGDICVSCTLDDFKIGIPSEKSCIAKKQLDHNLAETCLRLRILEGQNIADVSRVIECEICQNLHYVDKSGMCQLISIPNCKISDGKTKTCLLCKQHYIRNESGSLCDFQSFNIPFCQEQQEDICLRCQSLFYLLNQSQCVQITDPLCLQSNGITDMCTSCPGVDVGINPSQELCPYLDCKEFDFSNKQCKKCYSGYHLNDGFCRQTNLHNCLQSNSNQGCLVCDKGNTLFQDGFCYPTISSIENCEEDSELPHILCKKCVGDMQPAKMGGVCLQFDDCEIVLNACAKCKETSYLERQVCIKISNCVFQRDRICHRCQNGYYISQDKIKCLKIPGCQTSSGIHLACTVCEAGFQLSSQKQCVFDINLKNSVGCAKWKDTKNCQKCQNLFYLSEEGSCHPLTSLQGCVKSNGINDECLVCEISEGLILQKQLKLSTAQKNQQNEILCKPIPNCLVSDGVSVCLICSRGYAAFQKNCNVILDSIPNCLIHRNNQGTCSRCKSGFYIDIFNNVCVKINSKLMKNCLYSDGIIPKCAQCEVNYEFSKVLDSAYPKYDQICVYSKYQKFSRHAKIGCVGPEKTDSCEICFTEFYMEHQGQCLSRSIIKSCKVFDPHKDSCLICESGYLLYSSPHIPEDSRFCLPISQAKLVQDCAEYLPNTSICARCNQIQDLKLQQFYLDTKSNKCIDIAHLSCREFNLDTKTCLKGFINYCEEYQENNIVHAPCKKCSFGFFLKDGLCIELEEISNCVQYSLNKFNFCQKCEDFYELTPFGKCHKIQDINCIHADDPLNMPCTICRQNYALDTQYKCREIQTKNCLQGIESKDGIFICIKCFPRFEKSSDGKDCFVARKADPNCNSIKEGTCFSCKEGYQLNQEMDCIPLNQLCMIEHCSKISSISKADYLSCEICSANYYLNQNLQCLPIDPDSTIDIDSEIINQNPNASTQKDTWVDVLIISLILASLIILAFLVKKTIKERKSSFNNNPIEAERSVMVQMGINI